MNCYRHPNIASVYSCPKCNMGMCSECCDKAVYRIDGKPICHNCDKEIYATKLREYDKSISAEKTGIIISTVMLCVSLYFIINLCIYGKNDPSSSTWIGGSIICAMVTFWSGSKTILKQIFTNTTTESINAAINPWTFCFGKLVIIVVAGVILYFMSYIVPVVIGITLARSIYHLKVGIPKEKEELDKTGAYLESLDK